MKTNNKLDQFAADMCGVTPCSIGWEHEGEQFNFPWSLSDARCREIAREFFEIETLNDKWRSGLWKSKGYEPSAGGFCSALGKTIEAAEIACLAAIMEAE